MLRRNEALQLGHEVSLFKTVATRHAALPQQLLKLPRPASEQVAVRIKV